MMASLKVAGSCSKFIPVMWLLRLFCVVEKLRLPHWCDKASHSPVSSFFVSLRYTLSSPSFPTRISRLGNFVGRSGLHELIRESQDLSHRRTISRCAVLPARGSCADPIWISLD